MKIILLLLLTIANTFAYTQADTLQALVDKKRFTELNRYLEIHEKQLTKRDYKVYKGILLNALNQPDASLELVREVLSNPKTTASLSRKTLHLLHKTENDNYVKLFDYANAYRTGKDIPIQFSEFYTASQKESAQYTLKIWEVLHQNQIPAQQLIKNGDASIPLTRDLAGLWNVEVNAGGITENFVFDTGAGISTITDSYAQKLNVRLLEGSEIEVKSGITGIGNQTKIGVASELHLGNIIVKNAVFLVMPDAAFTFAGGAYKINGIIGFPIIKEFGEMVITGNELFVPGIISKGMAKPNLSFDFLKPIVYMTYEGEELPFTFDTGAKTSIFSDNFYKKYETALRKEGQDGFRTMGGAGGQKKMKILQVPTLTFQIGDTTAIFNKAEVSQEVISTNEDVYFGNIGQDLIKQFAKMTIHFAGSYIMFE